SYRAEHYSTYLLFTTVPCHAGRRREREPGGPAQAVRGAVPQTGRLRVRALLQVLLVVVQDKCRQEVAPKMNDLRMWRWSCCF
uniref:Uncharacterized protein n=1 Tax=Aegilops tauschii subsp. strangulata TaxID=200361 RepID=A0A453JSM6_AEGTS